MRAFALERLHESLPFQSSMGTNNKQETALRAVARKARPFPPSPWIFRPKPAPRILIPADLRHPLGAEI